MREPQRNACVTSLIEGKAAALRDRDLIQRAQKLLHTRNQYPIFQQDSKELPQINIRQTRVISIKRTLQVKHFRRMIPQLLGKMSKALPQSIQTIRLDRRTGSEHILRERIINTTRRIIIGKKLRYSRGEIHRLALHQRNHIRIRKAHHGHEIRRAYDIVRTIL